MTRSAPLARLGLFLATCTVTLLLAPQTTPGQCIDYADYMRRVAWIDMSTTNDVVHSGNHAFVATSSGLAVIDVSVPASPVLDNVFNTGHLKHLTIFGSYVYATNGSSNFLVIDVSDPTAPTTTAQVSIVGAGTLAMLGEHVVMAGSSVRVWDVAIPFSPVVIGSVSSISARDVAVQGDLIYLATNSPGLVIIDATNPESPSVVGSTLVGANARWVTVSGDRAYVGHYYGNFSAAMSTMDVSVATAPVPIDLIEGLGVPRVSADGDLLLASGFNSSLHVLDISAAGPPRILGTLASLGTETANFAFTDDYIYVSGDGFRVLERGDMGPPPALGTTLMVAPHDIEVVGNFAYIADGLGGLRVSNVTDPTAPRRGRRIDVSGTHEALGVTASRGYAYVAFGDVGLISVEVKGQRHLQIASITPTVDRAVEVTANDCYVYVAHDSGLQVMDIADPANPVPVSNVPLVSVRAAATRGNQVYAAVTGGLVVIDVSVPSAPVSLASIPLSGPLQDIVVAGDFAFVSSDRGTGAVDIVNIAIPSSPTLVSSFDVIGGARSIAHSGGVVYLAADASGVHVIDVSVPETPILLGTMDTPSRATGVDVSRGNVYVTDLDNGRLWPAHLTVGAAQCAPLGIPVEKSCVTLELEMQAGVGGSVSPETSERAPRSQVSISAVPEPHYVFREWVGQGNGSYSGFDSVTTVTTVTMYEPLQEVALFDRIGHEVTLSFSDTDPYVHEAPPIGLGNVYLWLACSTAGGITSFQGTISGTLPSVGFSPAPGVLSSGTATDLDLVMTSCVIGPALLGEFLILPPGEGTLFLSDGPGSPTSVRDCKFPTVEFFWPDDLKLVGVRTDGGPPIASGRGCTETVAIARSIDAATPSATSSANQLWASSPNPFIESTSIRYSLSTPGRVRLSVFSAAGRRVAELVNTAQSVGQHNVLWAGRSSSGGQLPAGVYFVRLEAPGFSQTRKVIRLRP